MHCNYILLDVDRSQGRIIDTIDYVHVVYSIYGRIQKQEGGGGGGGG